jgi:uncharacterized small protein (DUF1192 family)
MLYAKAGRRMEPCYPSGQDHSMINQDEDLPKKAKKLLEPPPLDMLGVGELKDYVAVLEAEILRVKSAISAKEAHKSAAALLFRNPDAGSEP